MTCYVYLIACNPKKRAPYIKIGMAKNPKKRIDTLQTGNPYELRMLACIPCKDSVEARHLESFIHKKLNTSRVRGEWFETNGGDLNKGLLEMAKLKGISEVIDAKLDDQFNSTQRQRLRMVSRKARNLAKQLKKVEEANKRLREEVKWYEMEQIKIAGYEHLLDEE